MKETKALEDLVSPTDFRYTVKELLPYLSVGAYTKYLAKVEAGIVNTYAKEGICSQKIADEVKEACENISYDEVKKEEDRIRHDIRALVNVIRNHVSDEAKPFVHMGATSYDIIDTANSMRIKEAFNNVIIPDIVKLEKRLMDLADQYKDTVQIGRTHGQHAVPITFGLYLAEYVARIGNQIFKIKDSVEELPGKLSGPVGAYNANSLLVKDPIAFEKQHLKDLGLEPTLISKQIVPYEPLNDLMHHITSTTGILANFAQNARHLQRSEINELRESFEKDQTGSSTMPHKRNPITFENIVGMFNLTMPKMITSYLTAISEHQRDLVNSSPQRWNPETIMLFDNVVRNVYKAVNKLEVDSEAMNKNFSIGADKAISEALQIMLSNHGYPNGHEKIRQLSLKSFKEGKTLRDLVIEDEDIRPYIENEFTQNEILILRYPERYIGKSVEKTEQVIENIKRKLQEYDLA